MLKIIGFAGIIAVALTSLVTHPSCFFDFRTLNSMSSRDNRSISTRWVPTNSYVPNDDATKASGDATKGSSLP